MKQTLQETALYLAWGIVLAGAGWLAFVAIFSL